ncbi:MAG: hypothetical protein LBI79_06650 [Nitrososphaerota archaeon]|nr:hypothetical protein [Nitrososphaerota archaeon]
MNKKTIYLIVAVLVIILVAAAAAVLLMGNNDDSDSNTTPPSVVNATSLKFTATDNTNDLIYNVAVRNINEANEEIRIDMTVEGDVFNYVIKLDGETSYMSMDDGATWMKSDFKVDSMYIEIVHGFIDHLEAWNGTDATYSYTEGGINFVISNISVNPTLSDSLFATS